MKMKAIIVCFAALFLLTEITQAQETSSDFPILSGPYLGQKPPGLEPEIFARGIISLEGTCEGFGTFSPDGKMFVYMKYLPEEEDPSQIWISELRDERWTKPVRAPFDTEHREWDYGFAQDRNRFYFTSDRPAFINGESARNGNIWFVDFVSSQWTEPQLVEYPVNTVEHYSGYPSLTDDGTMYFHSQREGGIGSTDIYRARVSEKGSYEVEIVEIPVNTPVRDFDPMIAPDESFILVQSDRTKEIDNKTKMFILFRNSDGSWSEPVWIEEALGHVALPTITPDGKYMLYTGGNKEIAETWDIYWIDIRALDQFRPESLK